MERGGKRGTNRTGLGYLRLHEKGREGGGCESSRLSEEERIIWRPFFFFRVARIHVRTSLKETGNAARRSWEAVELKKFEMSWEDLIFVWSSFLHLGCGTDLSFNLQSKHFEQKKSWSCRKEFRRIWNHQSHTQGSHRQKSLPRRTITRCRPLICLR
jgi:hypothetical protein